MDIRLPDGSTRTLPEGATAADLAADIGPGLARATLAARINDHLVDASHVLHDGDTVALVTDKSDEALDIVRHSTAHLLAMAVQALFPGAQVTIGPVIEDGFYYDFAYERPFTPEDLEQIEAKMHELARLNLDVEREEWERDDAVRHFESIGEQYKAKLIARIPAGETVSLYKQGEWRDLCRGPHVPNTNRLKVFKLMRVSGAYWEGNAENEQLQRIYGTAWLNKDDLKAYLHRLEEAEKRDHRKIGKALDLFHHQEEAPGMVFWHPKGGALWQVVEQYMRGVYRASGYQEVRCPQILDVSLWKKSGHWDNYAENMFFTESESRQYAVKPMNCPGHVQVYNAGLHSYRDLPIRYGEFGSCHRNEPSGALHGLMRVRAFTQDDGHVFCTEAQVESEVTAFHRQAMQVYRDFGFTEIAMKIALRPDKRIGSDEVWDKAEAALRAALSGAGVAWEELPGEGAFYGPKIEYHMRDCIGRAWQVGTIQVDFMMPERLGAEYVAEDDTRRHPVMLHRAIVGSMERFIGILIEHYEGRFPLWLAPVQAVVCNITDAQADYAADVAARLRQAGFRVESDLRNEKVGYKVRAHTLARVPYILVVGEREREQTNVSVRDRSGNDLGAMSVETWCDEMRAMVKDYR
jgi:threonyl-tRNA synthetase